MRCLVTGVAGFIGSHLAERLLADGHEVCGIDAFSDYYARSIKERNLEGPRSWRKFSFIEADLLSLDLHPILDGVDWIFHQAAQAGVRRSWGQEFARYDDCNIRVTERLLDVARQCHSLRRFIYASSSSIYGDLDILPVTEMALPCPLSPYGVTKLAAEHSCHVYYQNFSLPTVSLRYFTVYGPRQRPDMAFHRFCKAIINQEPVPLYGDGLQTRDFTYVSDIVGANIRAASADGVVGKVMNVAGGSRVSMRHVLELLGEISGLPVEIAYLPDQYGDVRHTFADITRAEQLIDYVPRVSLREGLAREFEDIVSLYASIRAAAA